MSMIAFVSCALAFAAVCTCCAASEAGSLAGPLTGPPGGLHAGEALLAAIQDSDVPRVRRVLDGLRQDGRSLPGPGRYGKTVLHEAAHACSGPGGAEIVALLIAAGADLNAANGVGLTPLHFAAFNAGGGPLARALVGRGARVDARDDEGRTPLHVANGPATTRALLDLGADPRATTEAGVTPDETKTPGASETTETLKRSCSTRPAGARRRSATFLAARPAAQLLLGRYVIS